MPQYTFKCQKCEHCQNVTMSVTEFLSSKDSIKKCPTCKKGKMFQQLTSAYGSIERSAQEIKQIVKEEAREIVKKMKTDDAREFRDICGETLNPLKN